MDRANYSDREQAFVKHLVLSKYLERLAFKVGGFKPGTTLNYVDGFSGPWDAVSADFKDSSPYIAAAELSKAKSILAASRQIPLTIRCMFVEKDPVAFSRLQALCTTTLGAVETLAVQGEFEQHLTEAVNFVRTGTNPFGFIFIDPTGWTGYGLRQIEPLLRTRPGEVLINFMTKDITRFVDDADSSALPSFQDLFGEISYRDRWRGLSGLDREDAIVARYCERIRETGAFNYCTSAIILNPKKDRTHYHLVYATRSLEGLVTFRDVERGTMPEQKHARAEAKARDRYRQTGQGSLFGADEMQSGYFDDLVGRYLSKARATIHTLLIDGGTVAYDDLLGRALSIPFVSATVVKDIVAGLEKAGSVEILGMKSRERVPKHKKGVRVKWLVGPRRLL